MKVSAIIPVAPFEPHILIEKSVESLRALDCTDLDFQAYYVIDSRGNDYSRLCHVLPPNFHVITRENSRGRRAGAINDTLSLLKDTDFIALFDVDSRPNKDFVKECIVALNAENSTVLASGCRFVTNKVNTLSKIVSVEYKFFCDVYRFSGRSKGFIQFNGAIGVSKADFLRKAAFDEACSCEDLDISEKIYLSGNQATLAETKIGEQAPTCVHDLYKQRVRWFRGAAEGISKYLVPIWSAPMSISKKTTWLCSLTIPFFSYLLVPFLPLYLRRVVKESDSLSESVKILLGLMGHACLMTVCGAVAIGQHATSHNREWAEVSRSEI